MQLQSADGFAAYFMLAGEGSDYSDFPALGLASGMYGLEIRSGKRMDFFYGSGGVGAIGVAQWNGLMLFVI